ncbi:MAG: hypothetical protein RIF34_10650 [Candidatus Kapaibacterium sp.]
MKFEHETKQIKLNLNTTAKHADCASFPKEAEEIFESLYRRNIGRFLSLYNAIERVAEQKKVDTTRLKKHLIEIGLMDEEGNWKQDFWHSSDEN